MGAQMLPNSISITEPVEFGVPYGVLLVDTGGLLFQDVQGPQPNLAYDPDGSFSGGLALPCTLYIGDSSVPNAGVLALWDAGASAWVSIMADAGKILISPGYLAIGASSTPADAALANSQLAIWLDATPGATKVKFKAKDSGGTVRTGSISLI